MKRQLEVTVETPVAYTDAARVFCGDPAAWLPELSTHTAYGRWGFYLFAGDVGLHVDCEIGKPRPEQGGRRMWRLMRWEPAAYHLDRAAPRFDGELGVESTADGASILRLRGQYQPPGGLLGGLADALGLRKVATGTTRALLAEIAERMAAKASKAQPSDF